MAKSGKLQLYHEARLLFFMTRQKIVYQDKSDKRHIKHSDLLSCSLYNRSVFTMTFIIQSLKLVSNYSVSLDKLISFSCCSTIFLDTKRQVQDLFHVVDNVVSYINIRVLDNSICVRRIYTFKLLI